MNDDQPHQTFVITIPRELARRALALTEGAQAGYSDLSELIAVALGNQLQLEGGAPAGIGGRTSFKRVRTTLSAERRHREADADELLRLPAGPPGLVAPASPGQGPLSPLTNRLGPLVLPLRVLANGSERHAFATLEDFVQTASGLARLVGIRLREADEQYKRRGREKKSVGWPVGPDELASMTRYRNFFLLGSDRPSGSGPLVDLGLATVVDGLPIITERGERIAREPYSPIDNLDDDAALSPLQRELFSQSMLDMPKEKREIELFLEAVVECGGLQHLVDAQLATAHPGWTEAQVVAQRAACMGRLFDLGVIDVTTSPDNPPSIVVGPAANDLLTAFEVHE